MMTPDSRPSVFSQPARSRPRANPAVRHRRPQVGNEDQLLRQVEKTAQGCRIFAIGIDRAVNAALLERLAGYGGGHCELVESEDRLDEVLRAVHRRLGAPLLTDIRLEPALEDLAPDAADLFPGVPLRLGGRFAGPVPTHVTVTGRTAEGQPFRQTLTPVETCDSAMRTLWARARVLDLEHRFAAETWCESRVADATPRSRCVTGCCADPPRRSGQSRRRAAPGDSGSRAPVRLGAAARGSGGALLRVGIPGNEGVR